MSLDDHQVSLTVGDVLDVRIDSVDLRRGKLKLSMLDAPKRAEHDERRRSRRTPRTTPEATQEFLREFQQVPADQLLLGCVTHITDAALFVTLRLETGTEADALLLPHHCATASDFSPYLFLNHRRAYMHTQKTCVYCMSVCLCVL